MVDISKNFSITQPQPAEQVDRLQSEDRLETLPVTTRVRHADRVDTSIKAKKETPKLFKVTVEMKRTGVISNADILKQAVEKAEATAQARRAFLRRLQEEEAATPSPITVANEKAAENKAEQDRRIEKAAAQKAQIAKALEGRDDSQEKAAAQQRAVIEAAQGQGNKAAKIAQANAQERQREQREAVTKDQAREAERQTAAATKHREERNELSRAQRAALQEKEAQARERLNTIRDAAARQSDEPSPRVERSRSDDDAPDATPAPEAAARSTRTPAARAPAVPSPADVARAAESDAPNEDRTDPETAADSRARLRAADPAAHREAIGQTPDDFGTSPSLQRLETVIGKLDTLLQPVDPDTTAPSSRQDAVGEPPVASPDQQLLEDSSQLEAIRKELSSGIEAMEGFAVEMRERPELARIAEPLLRNFADRLTTARRSLKEIGDRQVAAAETGSTGPSARDISPIQARQAQTLSQQIAQDIKSLAKSQQGVQPSAVAQLLS